MQPPSIITVCNMYSCQYQHMKIINQKEWHRPPNIIFVSGRSKAWQNYHGVEGEGDKNLCWQKQLRVESVVILQMHYCRKTYFYLVYHVIIGTSTLEQGCGSGSALIWDARSGYQSNFSSFRSSKWSHRGPWTFTMEARRLKNEACRACFFSPVIADSHHFDKDPDPF
jgi:hypothetical protein